MSLCITGNLNYHCIARTFFQTVRCSREIHQMKVKQVALSVAQMRIDILFDALAKEWLSLVFREAIMAYHLLGSQDWQAALPLSRYLRAFYWRPLQKKPLLLMLPDGLVNLGDGSDAGKVSHKVHSIISDTEEFTSACSEVLLIFGTWINGALS